MTDVLVDLEADDAGQRIACVKMSNDAWELNVRAAAWELARLPAVAGTEWSTRQSLAIGTAAGSPVFWVADGDKVSIMIGHDDETWDIAFSVSFATVAEIAAQAAALI